MNNPDLFNLPPTTFREHLDRCRNSGIGGLNRLVPELSLSQIVSLSQKDGQDNQDTPWCPGLDWHSFWFSRGQMAMDVLATVLAKRLGLKTLKIALPAYYCEVSLPALRKHGHTLCFYELDENLLPDMADLQRLQKEHGTPHLAIGTHYFGQVFDLSSLATWCQERGVFLLEDAAHLGAWVPPAGHFGQAILFTPWKFFQMPHGSVLWLSNDADVERASVEHAVKAVAPNIGLWLIKQLVKKYTGPLLSCLREPALTKKPWASEKPSAMPKVGCNPLVRSLLCQLTKDGSSGSLRRHNYRLYDDYFGHNGLANYRLAIAPEGDDFFPYFYPLMLPDEKTSWFLMASLWRRGFACFPWSDLSPEVKDKTEFEYSNRWRRQVITLPVHQGLNEKTVLRLAKEATETISQILSATSVPSSY
jgi:dTDP-4-amino-4,6-dideoxygalactose transaminase